MDFRELRLERSSTFQVNRSTFSPEIPLLRTGILLSLDFVPHFGKTFYFRSEEFYFSRLPFYFTMPTFSNAKNPGIFSKKIAGALILDYNKLYN